MRMVKVEGELLQIEDRFSLGEQSQFFYLENGSIILDLEGKYLFGRSDSADYDYQDVVYSKDGQDSYGFNYSLNIIRRGNQILLDFCQNSINFIFSCSVIKDFEII